MDVGELEHMMGTVFDDLSQATTTGHLVGGLTTLPTGATILITARPEIPALRCGIVAGALGLGASISPEQVVRLPFEIKLADCEDIRHARATYGRQVSQITHWVEEADRTLAAWGTALIETGWPGCDDMQFIDTAASRAHDDNASLLPICGHVPDIGLELHAQAEVATETGPQVRILLAQGDFQYVVCGIEPQEGLQLFSDASAERALAAAEQLDRRKHSVEWFMRLCDEDEQNGATS